MDAVIGFTDANYQPENLGIKTTTFDRCTAASASPGFGGCETDMSSAKHTKSTNNRQSSNKNEIDAENVAKRRKDSQTQGNQDDNPKKILKC